jgi:hypothetical protein
LWVGISVFFLLFINWCWPLPAHSFLVLSPMGLATMTHDSGSPSTLSCDKHILVYCTLLCSLTQYYQLLGSG